MIDDVIIKVYNNAEKFYRYFMVKDYELKTLLGLIEENGGSHVVVSRDYVNVFMDIRVWTKVWKIFVKFHKI